MKWCAPWNVIHSCGHCDHGWVCEEHPDKPWPSGCDCGAGMPCPNLLIEVEKFEEEAQARLGERLDE